MGLVSNLQLSMNHSGNIRTEVVPEWIHKVVPLNASKSQRYRKLSHQQIRFHQAQLTHDYGNTQMVGCETMHDEELVFATVTFTHLHNHLCTMLSITGTPYSQLMRRHLVHRKYGVSWSLTGTREPKPPCFFWKPHIKQQTTKCKLQDTWYHISLAEPTQLQATSVRSP